MDNNWFCNDPDGEGMTWHPTEAAALAGAAACIEAWIGDGEDWPEEVQEITVGCVTHRAQQSNIRVPALPLDGDDYDQEGVHWGGNEDFHCDYVMQPTGTLSTGEGV